jgi:hypothetical protein
MLPHLGDNLYVAGFIHGAYAPENERYNDNKKKHIKIFCMLAHCL